MQLRTPKSVPAPFSLCRHPPPCGRRATDTAAPSGQAAAAGKVAAGVLTGAYEATRFKAKPKLSPLESVQVLTPGDAGKAKAAMSAAAAFAAGTGVARSGPAPSASSSPCTVMERVPRLLPCCIGADALQLVKNCFATRRPVVISREMRPTGCFTFSIQLNFHPTEQVPSSMSGPR